LSPFGAKAGLPPGIRARLRYGDLLLIYTQAQVKDTSSTRISIQLKISKEKEMASFRKFALVALALVIFAGLLSAAAPTVTVTSTYAGFTGFRAEGLTEPIPPILIDFKGMPAGAATYDILLYGTSGAPITSPASAVGQSLSAGSTAGTVTILGGAVKISGVIFVPDENGEAKLTVSGLRIDANAIGANNIVSLNSVLVPSNGSNDNSTVIGAETPATLTFGIVTTSLSVANDATCSGCQISDTVTGPAWGPATSTVDPTGNGGNPIGLFDVTFTPLYAGAFATAAPEAALRFTFMVNNLPANLALWVPQSVTVVPAVYLGNALVTPAITAQLVAGADANGAGGSLASATDWIYRLNAAGTTSGQATYQLSATIPTVVPVQIPVYSSKDGTLSLTTAANPVTLTGSYAPLSTDIAADPYKTAGLLRFAATSGQTSSGFLATKPSSVSVSLPYVVTGSGWVSGLAIVNTGSSNTIYTNSGATGACTLNFFSPDGVTPAPAALKTPAIVPGGTIGIVLSDPAYLGTTGYYGPIVLQCNFDNVAVYSYVAGDNTSAAYVVTNATTSRGRRGN
jgi:hypothetical protein